MSNNSMRNNSVTRFAPGDRVWVFVDPANLVESEDDEAPVFECEVVAVTVKTRITAIGVGEDVYYELEMLASLDDLSRGGHQVYATREEAMAAGFETMIKRCAEAQAKADRRNRVLRLMKQAVGQGEQA
jgi:hypothetical protein